VSQTELYHAERRRLMRLPLVVVSCGDMKHHMRTEAQHMYIGPYATSCRLYGLALARSLGGAPVKILSAKWGFIDLRAIIEPYDVAFGDRDAISLEDLKRQAAFEGVDRRVIMIGGRRYFEIVRKCWPHTAERGIPIGAETRGIGNQLRWLKHQTRELELNHQPLAVPV